MQILPYVLEIDGQEVVITPDPTHEYTATTEQVALGYNVSAENIRKHKETKNDELIEGKHWVVSNTHTPGGRQLATLWTKRGIVRLGFFIRSARARKFRDMAEDLVIGELEKSASTLALISARMIGEVVKVSKKGVAMSLKRAGIIPAHHFIEPKRHVPAYLWPLEEVKALYPGHMFPVFQGDVRDGLPNIKRSLGNVKKTALPAANSLTPIQQMGADLAQQIVDDFVRDELPRRFKALFGSQVSA